MALATQEVGTNHRQGGCFQSSGKHPALGHEQELNKATELSLCQATKQPVLFLMKWLSEPNETKEHAMGMLSQSQHNVNPT